MSDCYKILTSDGDGSCYRVDTAIGTGCFSVSIDSGADDELPSAPLEEFTIDGFTYIKSMHAHGLFRLLVLGKYKPTENSDILEVLAVVGYIPSVLGGVGEIGTVEQYVLLSDMSLDLGSVKEVDGYDTQTSLSKIHLTLTTLDVVWLHPVSLLPTHDSRTYNSVGTFPPGYFPYVDEDTYGYVYTSGNTIYSHQHSIDEGIPTYPIDKPISWESKVDIGCAYDVNCSSENIIKCVFKGDPEDVGEPGVPVSGDIKFHYMQAISQSDGSVVNTNIGYYLSVITEDNPSYIRPNRCRSDGTYSKRQNGGVLTKREGVIIMDNGDIYLKNTVRQSHTYATELIKYIARNPFLYKNTYRYAVHACINTGMFLGDKTTTMGDINPLGYGLQITLDNEYFIAKNMIAAWAYKLDGSKSGHIRRHETCINGVILYTLNRGTSIAQTKIDNLL